jgi:ATP-binding cassette subfamily C protein
MINSPHNPTGAVLSETDMKELASIVEGTNIIILSDEVYEHLIFDGIAHQSILKYPALLERSFVCFSFGKTYHCTGWKLGYCIAPAALMNEFRKVHQFNCFTCDTPKQVALASYLSNKEILSTLAIFIVAMFRLLPSTNRIIGCLNAIKFYSSSGKIINEELNKKSLRLKNYDGNRISESINFNSNIKLENIGFSYLSSEKKILKDLNLIINKNEMIAIIGENGSGKSTLLNIICCLLKPGKGKIYIDGLDIDDNQISLQKKIGFVQQRTFIFDDTLLNNIIFGRKETKTINYLHLQEVIKDSNLQSFVANLPNGLETNLGEMGRSLSGGETQKIGIARALYKKSEILLLDEATSALDENAEEEILNTIAKLKKKVTIIAITHKKDFLKYCDKVYNIKDLQNH